MLWKVCLSLSLHRLWVWPRWCWPIPGIFFFFFFFGAMKPAVRGHTEAQKGCRNTEGISWRTERLKGKMYSSGTSQSQWGPAAGVYPHGPLSSSNDSSRISGFFHAKANASSQRKWGKRQLLKLPYRGEYKVWHSTLVWRIVSLPETLLKGLTLLCLYDWTGNHIICFSMKASGFLLLSGLHITWCFLTKLYPCMCQMPPNLNSYYWFGAKFLGMRIENLQFSTWIISPPNPNFPQPSAIQPFAKHNLPASMPSSSRLLLFSVCFFPRLV